MNNMEGTDKAVPSLRVLLIFLIAALISLSCDLIGGGTDSKWEEAEQDNIPTQIRLDCPQQIAVEVGQTTSATVVLGLQGKAPQNLELRMEGLRGNDWQTALCYQTHCFITDGMGKIIKTVPWVDGAALEIKFFIPSSATSGQSLTVRLTATPSNRRAGSATIEVTGYIP